MFLQTIPQIGISKPQMGLCEPKKSQFIQKGIIVFQQLSGSHLSSSSSSSPFIVDCSLRADDPMPI